MHLNEIPQLEHPAASDYIPHYYRTRDIILVIMYLNQALRQSAFLRSNTFLAKMKMLQSNSIWFADADSI